MKSIDPGFLNPDMFCEPNIRRAYQAAKEIPERRTVFIVMASVPGRLF